VISRSLGSMEIEGVWERRRKSDGPKGQVAHKGGGFGQPNSTLAKTISCLPVLYIGLLHKIPFLKIKKRREQLLFFFFNFENYWCKHSTSHISGPKL